MITGLSAKNFKSWESLEGFKLAGLTGVFGANSSGKTSIIQLLLLLKQTVLSSNRFQVFDFGRSYVDLGSFKDIVFNHDVSKQFKFELQMQLPRRHEIHDPEDAESILFDSETLHFHCAVTSTKKGAPLLDSFTYDFGGNLFKLGRKPDRSVVDLTHTGSPFQFKRTRGRKWELPLPVKFYGFPDQVWAYYQNARFLSDFELLLEEQLRGLLYLGPIREFPQREYKWSGVEPNDMGMRGDKAVDALLASRESGRKIGRGKGKKRMSVEEYVGFWLKELNLIHDFRVERIGDDSNLYRVMVKKTAHSPEVLITDVGFGVSQLLPVLTICYYAPSGSTIIIEQPEIHLHPVVQAGLADVFIDAVKHNQVQIIVESHSEYLLRRLQRRIAEQDLKESDAALYFCHHDGRKSILTSLELDLFGSIRNWPDGFFGNDIEEISKIHEAVKRRLHGVDSD